MNPVLLAAAPKLADALISAGRELIDAIIPGDSPEQVAQKQAAQLKIYELAQAAREREAEREAAISAGQLKLNELDSSSESGFRTNWRPALGWTCVGGFAYQLVLRPFFVWLSENLGWTVPPSLELETLMTMLFALLGLGAYRTAEKIQRIKHESGAH